MHSFANHGDAMSSDSRPSHVFLIPQQAGEVVAENSPFQLSGDLLRDSREIRPRELQRRSTTDEKKPPTEFTAELVEVEFEEGQRLWLTGAEFASLTRATSTRGGEGAAEQAPDASVDVAKLTHLQLEGTVGQKRGPLQLVIKACRFFGLNLEENAAETLGAAIDAAKASGDIAGVLKRFKLDADNLENALADFHDQVDVAGDEPYLLFIHGTLTNTVGSFGGLWEEKGDADDVKKRKKRVRETLVNLYGERVLAFDHGTLTVSPVENLEALVSQLKARFPQGVKLHLVTHSRGGMIGELLSRLNFATVGSTPTAPFVTEELDLFNVGSSGSPSDGASPALAGQRNILKKLNDSLDAKSTPAGEGLPAIQVERFVRVACPVMGTTLASGKLDRWLNLFGNIAGRAIPDTPTWNLVKDASGFIAAVVAQKTNPAKLPGLHAMMPGSPLVKLLNYRAFGFDADDTRKIPGELVVIAGDTEPDGWWKRLLNHTVELFFEGNNDLVVNTDSMKGGLRRTKQNLESFHRGDHVTHFRYFSNEDSSSQLVRALTRKSDDTSGFLSLNEPAKAPARGTRGRKRATAPAGAARPVVVVLPGIMGSSLSLNGRPVWIDYGALFSGGLSKLALDQPGVAPTSPVESFYGKLIEYLKDSHEVIPFAYDWRQSLANEADRLHEKLEPIVAGAVAARRPVRFLAHSMGGLLARCLFARHPKLWQDVRNVDGSRLVMLGTPNQGSFRIIELLTGHARFFQMLALFDITANQTELLKIISNFPGVLQLLPSRTTDDYFDLGTWRQLHDWMPNGWELPDEKKLKAAREVRTAIESTQLNPINVCYVAGSASETLVGVRTDKSALLGRHRLTFLATGEGDGQVPWSTGIPRHVPTWYVKSAHGDIPANADDFEAFLELLEQGKTNLLPSEAPASRGADQIREASETSEVVLPTPDEFAAAAMGGARKRRRAADKADAAPIRVSVQHGHLISAESTVAVGHYTGDPIVSAEKALDVALDGELTRQLKLGVYPGPIETSALFLHPRFHRSPRPRPSAGLVVGLGLPGALTASKLKTTMLRALLEYASEWRKLQGQGDESRELKISSLLIGTGTGGMTVRESVHAIVKAVVEANQALKKVVDGTPEPPTRFAALEFVEMYLDQALEARDVIADLDERWELRDAISSEPKLVGGKAGETRLRRSEPEGWWQRLQVRGLDDDGVDDGTLRFQSLTGRARNEVQLIGTDRKKVDAFLQEIIRETDAKSEASKTLFELLLPNELKEMAPEQDNLVLLVDEASARYPWEMLQDPLETSGEPLAARMGIVRQLAVDEYREMIRPALGNTALVVGDPPSSCPPLPQAQSEARDVAKRLRNDGFVVEHLDRPSASQVLKSMFNRTYRVLHLAGHGMYRQQPDIANCECCGQAAPPKNDPHSEGGLTGMVIGEGQLLTPSDIRQLRRVPEFVFINCCHLGHIEAGAVAGDAKFRQAVLNRRDFHLFAANVATEFIRMGVKAVVAAGWAVDDASAGAFANTIYRELLKGESFGAAVKTARANTLKSHAYSNTWGAYQCYGDPSYHLVAREPDADREDAGAERADAMKKASILATWSSEVELINEIRNRGQRLSILAANADRKEHRDWLKRLADELLPEQKDQPSPADETPKEPASEDAGKSASTSPTASKNSKGAARPKRRRKPAKKNSQLYAALASALSDAGEFNLASELYHVAIALEDGAASVKNIEQLANLLVRRAALEAIRTDAKAHDITHRLADIDRAIGLFKWLNARPDFGSTLNDAGDREIELPKQSSERASLLGSAFKRRFWLEPTNFGALQEGCGWYETAWKLTLEASPEQPDPYPLINWHFLNLIRVWLDTSGAKPEFDLKPADRALALRTDPHDVWTAANRVDIELLRLLIGATTDSLQGGAKLTDGIDEIVAGYLEVAKRSNRREYSSMLEHSQFLLDSARHSESTVKSKSSPSRSRRRASQSEEQASEPNSRPNFTAIIRALTRLCDQMGMSLLPE